VADSIEVHVQKAAVSIEAHVQKVADLIEVHVQKEADLIEVHVQKAAVSIEAHVQKEADLIEVHVQKEADSTETMKIVVVLNHDLIQIIILNRLKTSQRNCQKKSNLILKLQPDLKAARKSLNKLVIN
jgi:hypothetical protein